MNKNNFINIIDFGSSKIRLTVFNNEFDIQFSQSFPNKINDKYSNTTQNLKEIIKIAEKNISSHIENVLLMLDSNNQISIDISIGKKFENKQSIIKIYESLILEINQLINSNYFNYNIIHTLLSRCIIDGKNYNHIPDKKIKINEIQAEFKIICLPKRLITDIKNDFAKDNIQIIDIYCTSYIKSLSYNKKINSEKIAFIEIGLKRASLILLSNYKLEVFHTIPIGSLHITKDISNVLNVDFDEAENIKKFFNKSETEFSYNNQNNTNSISIKNILNKNISIDTLKQVILYRVQEILDLLYRRSNISNINLELKNISLYFIGEGSKLLNNNSFHLEDNFNFKSISFYDETNEEICNAGLNFYLNTKNRIIKSNKKQGFFERFFNYFSK